MRRDSASTKGDSFTPAGNKDDLPYQPGSLEGGCQIRSEQRNGASHSILRWAKAILLFNHVASDNRIQLYSPFFFFLPPCILLTVGAVLHCTLWGLPSFSCLIFFLFFRGQEGPQRSFNLEGAPENFAPVFPRSFSAFPFH